ncbi:unnamed protein product, partial [Mesorhabditis spiculigera]
MPIKTKFDFPKLMAMQRSAVYHHLLFWEKSKLRQVAKADSTEQELHFGTIDSSVGQKVHLVLTDQYHDEDLPNLSSYNETFEQVHA